MDSYAIAEIQGYQYRVEEGGRVRVPRMKAAEGDTVKLDKLVLVNRDGKVTVGKPYIEDTSAEAKIVGHSRGPKVRVFKKKRRKGYKKQASARKYETTLEITRLS